jgi:type IV pilus assembly protein PilW
MKSSTNLERGYTLIELLIALAIGVVLIGGVIVVFLAQTQTYRVANSQAGTQSAENAIAALVTPVVRSAGFAGCAAVGPRLTSNLNPGGPPPLDVQPPVSSVVGFDANGTTGSGTLTLVQLNAANNSILTSWTPSLDPSLQGAVESGSDVLVLFGSALGSKPVSVTSIAGGASTLTVQDASAAGSGIALAAGQLAAVSDCGLATLFKITGVAGNVITHAAGAGALANGVAAISLPYANPVLTPMQQTALYVAQGQGGQSILTLATYINGSWTQSPLVPGVENMQVLYGIGINGAATQYVAASSLTPTTAVYSVRLGFLISGQPGATNVGNPRSYNVLGTVVVVPQDTRLRRVYEMTVKVRNAS